MHVAEHARNKNDDMMVRGHGGLPRSARCGFDLIKRIAAVRGWCRHGDVLAICAACEGQPAHGIALDQTTHDQMLRGRGRHRLLPRGAGRHRRTAGCARVRRAWRRWRRRPEALPSSRPRINRCVTAKRRAGKLAAAVGNDGGRSWAEAALQDPVRSKAFTRFRMPWQWNGAPAILQSRAWDEDGNAQPTRAEFVAARGELPSVPPVLAFGNHHFNAITGWAIDQKGQVTHAYA